MHLQLCQQGNPGHGPLVLAGTWQGQSPSAGMDILGTVPALPYSHAGL